jgi:hypothetical protein
MGTWGPGTLESDGALDSQARLAAIAGIADASVLLNCSDPKWRMQLESALPRLVAFIADGGLTAELFVDEPPEFAAQLATWAQYDDGWAVLAVMLMGQGCALSDTQHAQLRAGCDAHRYLTDRATVEAAARTEPSETQVEQALAFVEAAVAEKRRVLAALEHYNCAGGEPWFCASAGIPPRARDHC